MLRGGDPGFTYDGPVCGLSYSPRDAALFFDASCCTQHAIVMLYSAVFGSDRWD